MIANYPCAVAMLIAQLTFRGMPLAQGMTLAKLIRLLEIRDSEVRCLLDAAMDLPISALPKERICFGKHTFPNVGAMIGDLIMRGFSQKLGAEKIGILICMAGWILSAKLEPQQTVSIMSDAIQSVLSANAT